MDVCQVLNSLSRAQNIAFLDVSKVTVFLTVLFILNNGLINEQKKPSGLRSHEIMYRENV